MSALLPKFFVGQLVHHNRFDYRGVIIDVDPIYQGSDTWYEQIAKSRPAKDQPWYHVLVHNGDHFTYVAERNLEPDRCGEPISHPALESFFKQFDNGVYTSPRH